MRFYKLNFSSFPPQIIKFVYLGHTKYNKILGGSPLKINLKQLSFTDIYSNVDEYFQQDKPKLIKLFEQHIDLRKLIPQSFYNH